MIGLKDIKISNLISLLTKVFYDLFPSYSFIKKKFLFVIWPSTQF